MEPIIAVWSVDRRTRNYTWDKTECEIAGENFSAVSHSGSGHALCRKLVAAGVPDGPMEVRTRTGKPMYQFASIHLSAQYCLYRDPPVLVKFNGEVSWGGKKLVESDEMVPC